MTLDLPGALIGLLALPILLSAYVWRARRRSPAAFRHPNAALVRAAVGSRPSWKRHLPLALVLGAMGALALASTRPSIKMEVPRQRTSIIVAIDVSRSMCAVDVEPNRLAAAKAALRAFIDEQDADTRIGLIAFAGFAEVISAPTTDKESLMETVDALSTGRGTAIGAAILKSVDAIAAINPAVPPIGPDEAPAAPPDRSRPEPAPPLASVDAPTADPVSDVVVLLTDGANTRGVTPMDAARIAGSRGIRVYPIGFGTAEPTRMSCTRDQLGGDVFAEEPYGGPAGVMAQFLVVDEPMMAAVAKATGGTYAPATDREQLTSALKDVPRELVLTREKVEISAALAALGALLIMGAVLASVRLRTFP